MSTLVLALVLYLSIQRNRLKVSVPKWGIPMLGTFLFLSIGTTLLYWITYLTYDSYWDHVQPTMTVIGLIIRNGGLAYTPIEAAARYSMLYGPTVFIANGIGALFGTNPILGSKLMGVFAAILSVIGITLIAKKKFSLPVSRAVITYFIIVSLSFGMACYWNRPDSFMLLGTVGCSLGLMTSPLLAFFLVSLSTAIVCNGKIHGLLYVIPFIPLFIKKRGMKWSLLTAITATGLAIFPFISKSFSLSHYLDWLAIAGHHPLSFEIFVCIALVVAAVLGPIYLLGARLGYTASICLGIVSILASKVGAGPHHLLPFIPYFALILGETLNKWPINGGFRHWPKLVQLTAFALVGPLSMAILIQNSHVLYNLNHNRKRATELKSELLQIKNTYPEKSIVMGYSDPKNYYDTFLRPLLYTPNTVYLFDAMSMMDMLESGLQIPQATLDMIKNHQIDVFVFPKGPIWQMNLAYPSKKPIPLFDAEFVALFKAHYELKSQGKNYSTWIPKSADNRL